MMFAQCNRLRLVVICSAIVLSHLTGCGGAPLPSADQKFDLSTSPLTTAAWEQIESPEKYEPQYLARLRKDNPQLKSFPEWKKYHEEVIQPAFKREVGGQLPAPKK